MGRAALRREAWAVSLRHWAALGGLSCVLVVISGHALARADAPKSSGPTQNLSLTVPAPVNVRVTQSLSTCRTYAGGGLAGIGCAAAMGNHWYILVWDWRGVNIDGFQVYQTPSGPVARDPWAGKTPIQTIPQNAQVRVALLDPSQVGTNGCFTVTAYFGTIESPRSAQICVNAASATNPIFKSVALSPSPQMQFYASHHERTHRSDCSSGSWPQFADGTLVWSSIAPVPLDWGMLMYVAYWHGGTQPFPCPEFFTQVLRLGLVFPLPSDVATLQSATLVGTVQQTNGNCSYALYSLASETIAVNPTQQVGSGPQPGGFAEAIPGQRLWQATTWLYPASSAIAGFWTWPASENLLQLNTDVTAVVRQHSDSAAFLLEPQDSITWITGDAFGSPAGSSFVRQDIPLCQTIIQNIRLNLKYISTN